MCGILIRGLTKWICSLVAATPARREGKDGIRKMAPWFQTTRFIPGIKSFRIIIRLTRETANGKGKFSRTGLRLKRRISHPFVGELFSYLHMKLDKMNPGNAACSCFKLVVDFAFKRSPCIPEMRPFCGGANILN